MKKIVLKTVAFSLLLMSVACNAEVSQEETIVPSPTPLTYITATLPATRTPYPSSTPMPSPSVTPIAPVEGQATSQLNVRDVPSVAGNKIGTIGIFEKVQVVGKDSSESWWMIIFPDSVLGRGWVSAQFLQVEDASGVSVIPDATQVLGTGVNPTAESGDESAPTVIPTEVLKIAPLDGDSADAPSVNVTLSEKSLSSFSYSDELSIPEGDAEDWLRFGLEGSAGQQKIVLVILDCSGGGALNLELIQNSVLLQNWEKVNCGQRRQLQLYLFVGAPYSLRIYPVQNNTTLNYLAYTLTVQLTK